MKTQYHRIATALLAGVVLLGALPTGVAARGVTGRTVLNQDATEIGSATVDGERYQVYRYENTLAYASGISVYHDGEQVTSERRVREVLTHVAQRRAAAKLGEEEIAALQTVRREARRLANATGSTVSALNDTTTRLSELRDVRVDGRTAWNASVERAPRLPEFDRTATELLDPLRRTERYSRAVASNATALIELIEKRQNGTGVDPQRLYEQYATTLHAMDRLSDMSYDVEGQTALATLGDRIATNVSEVPEFGDRLATRFETVSNRTRLSANRSAAAFATLDEVAGWGTPLKGSQEFAQSRRSEWMDQWHSRRHAPREVYGTLLGVPIALGGVIGLAWWRR